jgi:hypothetical protein
MSTAGEDSRSGDSKATTVPLPGRDEEDDRSTAMPRPEQLDADEAALRLRLVRAFRSQRPSGVGFGVMVEPGPSQSKELMPLQSDADKADLRDWLQRPLEWDAKAMWAWGLPPRWYSALRWWVLKDGSYSEEMLLDVAETKTLDLVWLSNTRKELAEWDAEVVAREKDADRERVALLLIERQRWDELVERTHKKTPAKAAPSLFSRNQFPSGHEHEGSPYERGSTREGLRSSTKKGVVLYPVEDADQEAEDTACIMLLNEMGGAAAMHEGSVFDLSEPKRVGYPHGIALGQQDIRILARAFRHLGVGEE